MVCRPGSKGVYRVGSSEQRLAFCGCASAFAHSSHLLVLPRLKLVNCCRLLHTGSTGRVNVLLVLQLVAIRLHWRVAMLAWLSVMGLEELMLNL